MKGGSVKREHKKPQTTKKRKGGGNQVKNFRRCRKEARKETGNSTSRRGAKFKGGNLTGDEEEINKRGRTR